MPEATAGSQRPAAVEEISIRRLAMPLDPPIRSGIHHIDGIHTLAVEASGGGETGVGYAFAFSPNEIRASAAMAADLAAVARAEPRAVGDHWQAMWDRLNFSGHEGPGAMALAAIDTALWDLTARQAGLPLHDLLGAAAPATELYAAGGWLSWSVEQVIEEGKAFAEAGYRAYKMRVGSCDWRTDAERVRAVRDALPAEVGLMIDVNQAWSVETALAAGAELEELGLAWIEEPVDALDMAGQARLARELGTPVAAGETLWGLRSFSQLLDAGGVDIVQLDLMRCGGITPFLEIAALVEAAGLPVASHLFTPISAHLMAALPGGCMAEHLPSWFDPLFEPGPRIADGLLLPGEEPGLGLTLAPSALERWEATS